MENFYDFQMQGFHLTAIYIEHWHIDMCDMLGSLFVP